MNLGKLLGAGKSFISGRKSAAYRARRHVYLPKFGAEKNPFVNPAAGTASAEAMEASAPAPATVLKKNAPVWAKTQKMPDFKNAGATARAASWVSKLNPVSIFRAAPSAGQAAPPVQTELSLEKVKVVHNDLTDADVEVVPLKSRPANGTILDKQPAGKSWEELGERIMKMTAL